MGKIVSCKMDLDIVGNGQNAKEVPARKFQFTMLNEITNKPCFESIVRRKPWKRLLRVLPITSVAPNGRNIKKSVESFKSYFNSMCQN